MIHVVFVGDSFSDDGRRSNTLDLSALKKAFNYYNIGFPNAIKFSSFLALDVLNQNLENIKIHTLGRGSYGNHVIYHKLKEKVLEIKNEGNNDKIYAIVQLSALVRKSNHINIPNLDVKDFVYDYLDEKEDLSYKILSNIFIKHLDNIENIHNFCLEHNVEKFIYFGWAVIYDSDFNFYGCEDRKEKIKQIVNFYPYEECYDEMETYCSGKKPKTINITKEDKLYFVDGGSFGGHTEYIRSKLNVGERYFMRHDAHLSTRSYQLFYNDIIKKWFIKKNIIEDVEMNENTKKRIENGIKWEDMKYQLLTNSSHSNSEIIRDLCFEMFRGDQIDFNYCERKFKELNNKLI